MLQHVESVTIAARTEDAWRFVRDMANWASSMPGYQSFEVVSDDDSIWTLKVGVGALVKTVQVVVHVEEWREPDLVRFTYKLANEPVHGGGHYHARRVSEAESVIDLDVRVEGGGPMAPVWEAMARPILPKLARDFGAALKAMIEAETGDPLTALAREQQRRVGLWTRIMRWLSRVSGGRRVDENVQGPANG